MQGTKVDLKFTILNRIDEILLTIYKNYEDSIKKEKEKKLDEKKKANREDDVKIVDD
jgi:hypothetical protein